MSFGTSNKFSVLQVQQPKQPKPKGDKEVNAAPGPKNEKSAVKDDVAQKPKQENNDNRGKSERGRGGNRGSRGSRGGNRGGRGGNSDRPPRDPNQPPKNRNKREFDRISLVPKNEAKKSNFGTGNWGTEKEDARGAEDAKKEIDSTPKEEVKVEEPNNNNNNIIVAEPEDKTITLKEYQEQLAALAPKIDAPKRREAGEGEKSDLHKYVVLKKDEDEEFKQLNNIKIKEKKERKKNQNKKTNCPFD